MDEFWSKVKEFFAKIKNKALELWGKIKTKALELWAEAKKYRLRLVKVDGTAEIYKRQSGEWSFRLVASNGQIVAVDGAQGYENRADAIAVLERLLRGKYGEKIVEVAEKKARKRTKK